MRLLPFVFSILVTGTLFAANPIPEDCRVGPFAVGCQAYTFNRFTLFEAIEKTEAAGGKIIELYSGQKVTRDDPSLVWGHNAPDDVIEKVKAKLAKHKIRAVNYGVVGFTNDETEARKIFDFAKKMELYAITTESVDVLDLLEKLVKEYDIKLGIHEHAKNPANPNYRIWDPNYVYSLIKDRDSRIGACADTGHWVRSGIKPVDALKILKGRIISTHLKDRSAFGDNNTHEVVYGTGVSDIKGILDELKAQNFAGNISIEYEYNWDHSVPDVAQCIGFIRGWSVFQN